MIGLITDPGQLNQRVDIMQKVETPNGVGGLTIIWSLVGSVWAKLVPVHVSSSLLGQQDQERSRHKIYIRKPAQIVSGWKLVMGVREFEVTSVVDPDETDRFLELMTEEVGR